MLLLPVVTGTLAGILQGLCKQLYRGVLKALCHDIRRNYELISSKIQLKWVQEVWARPVLRYSVQEFAEQPERTRKFCAIFVF